MEKYEFIKQMLQNRNLSINDKKRLVLLATKEIERIDMPVELIEKQEQKEVSKAKTTNARALTIHAPKDTASFLSLFNDPNGFKFLTHDFDPNSDMNYDKLMKQVREQFNIASSKYKIPIKFWSFINAFINGGGTWMDCDGGIHEGNYASKEWIEWSRINKIHLLSNEKYSNDILKFRSNIRLVKPKLLDIVNDIVVNVQKKIPNMVIQTHDLEKADFYTSVWNLKDGIRRILEDMSRYADKTPNVIVSFERKYDDEFSQRIIRITQVDSVSYSLDEVIRKFHDKKHKGGAFNEIKNVFTGFCNWSVESLWDGNAKRWNILNDTDVDEIEDIEATSVSGFTHILTYFSK